MSQENVDELKRQIKDLESKVAYLNAQLKEDNRFGLKWIDVPEAFDAESENKIPILEEVPELAITNNDGKPTHILIEGDNYHALTCLNYTHHGKVDVIYIDPPYNTGSDGFTYNDKRFLDKYPDGSNLPVNHPLRHSSWLSFMSKRIELAHDLLTDEGVILISIDDNEYANLKLLCDKVFDGKNYVATFIWRGGKRNMAKWISTSHEYMLMYAKNLSSCSAAGVEWREEKRGLKEIFDFEIKLRKKYKSNYEEATKELKQWFKKDASLESREHEHYCNIDEKGIYCMDNVSRVGGGKYSIVNPINNKIIAPPTRGWAFGKEEDFWKAYNEGRIMFMDNNNLPIFKRYLHDNQKQLLDTVFYKDRRGAKIRLRDLMGGEYFEYPKDEEIIAEKLKSFSKKNSVILDFFAGSGTTMHSTMQLNAEDGGQRQCILININENNICRNVTYERNKRVIEGYVTPKGLDVKGLGNSLKYYRTAFVGANDCSQATDNDRTVLAQKAGCLLALAENTLYEQKTTDNYQIFKDKDRDVWTAVYFKEDYRPKYFNEFVDAVKALTGTKNVYIFSWGDVGSFDAYFDDDSYAHIKGIPQPILDIYKSLNS